MALIGCAVSEIGDGNVVCAAILVGKAKARPDRDLGPDDAVATIEILFLGEHVHRAALPLGIAAGASGQFRHDTFRVHVTGQHMAVIAVTGNDLVAFLQAGLHAGHNGFLTDIEVAEAGNLAHAVELPRLLFKPADQEHVPIVFQHLCLAGFGRCLF